MVVINSPSRIANFWCNSTILMEIMLSHTKSSLSLFSHATKKSSERKYVRGKPTMSIWNRVRGSTLQLQPLWLITSKQKSTAIWNSRCLSRASTDAPDGIPKQLSLRLIARTWERSRISTCMDLSTCMDSTQLILSLLPSSGELREGVTVKLITTNL